MAEPLNPNLLMKVIVPRATSTNEEMAVRYTGDAKSFAQAAAALRDVDHFAPRYFLICHAFELILKAAILATGGSQEELWKELGHDLDACWKRAADLGYTASHPDAHGVVYWLSDFHKDHAFRYRKTGYITVPRAEDVIDIFESVHAEIAKVTRAAYLTKAADSR